MMDKRYFRPKTRFEMAARRIIDEVMKIVFFFVFINLNNLTPLLNKKIHWIKRNAPQKGVNENGQGVGGGGGDGFNLPPKE